MTYELLVESNSFVTGDILQSSYCLCSTVSADEASDNLFTVLSFIFSCFHTWNVKLSSNKNMTTSST